MIAVASVARRGFGEEVPHPDDLEISLDFSAVQRGAERVRAMLLDLRTRYDLAPYEYCKQVRIAPSEIPYSHPRITLNTWVRDDLGLLSMYLHEQMHWYVTWYSHARAASWHAVLERLRRRYPNLPDAAAGGADDAFSTLLHLMVNWLEIEAVSRFIGRDRVVDHFRSLPFYQWIYRTVLDDGEPLGALYREHGLLPMRHATEMSADDLTLAGLGDEAPG
ncbi:MAG TPA: hypothetical protein VE865_10930 [Bradyrhizobium sp.]|nr:hypothetical protein [Bradyrhizobium sp.]